MLTEACRGKGITLFLSFQLVMTCLDFCCNALLCVWHVWLMYSRDENVFKILALFTYDYENICMNRLLEYILLEMYVCRCVWFTYICVICNCCMSMYGTCKSAGTTRVDVSV